MSALKPSMESERISEKVVPGSRSSASESGHSAQGVGSKAGETPQSPTKGHYQDRERYTLRPLPMRLTNICKVFQENAPDTPSDDRYCDSVIEHAEQVTLSSPRGAISVVQQRKPCDTTSSISYLSTPARQDLPNPPHPNQSDPASTSIRPRQQREQGRSSLLVSFPPYPEHALNASKVTTATSDSVSHGKNETILQLESSKEAEQSSRDRGSAPQSAPHSRATTTHLEAQCGELLDFIEKSLSRTDAHMQRSKVQEAKLQATYQNLQDKIQALPPRGMYNTSRKHRGLQCANPPTPKSMPSVDKTNCESSDSQTVGCNSDCIALRQKLAKETERADCNEKDIAALVNEQSRNLAKIEALTEQNKRNASAVLMRHRTENDLRIELARIRRALETTEAKRIGALDGQFKSHDQAKRLYDLLIQVRKNNANEKSQIAYEHKAEITGLLIKLQDQTTLTEKYQSQAVRFSQELEDSEKTLEAVKEDRDRLCSNLYDEIQLQDNEIRRQQEEITKYKTETVDIFHELAVLQITMRHNLGLDALRKIRQYTTEELVVFSTMSPDRVEELYRIHLDALDSDTEYDVLEHSVDRLHGFVKKVTNREVDQTRSRITIVGNLDVLSASENDDCGEEDEEDEEHAILWSDEGETGIDVNDEATPALENVSSSCASSFVSLDPREGLIPATPSPSRVPIVRNVAETE